MVVCVPCFDRIVWVTEKQFGLKKLKNLLQSVSKVLVCMPVQPKLSPEKIGQT